MRATNKYPILLTILTLSSSQIVFAGSVPFTSDDLNLESAINSNAVILDVLSNDDSGISGDDYKEVVALCDISSSDQDCTGNSYSDANGSASINGTGDNNNILFTSDGSASTLFQFKYVMQNSILSTGSATAEVALTHFEVNNLSDSGTNGCDSAECTLREAIDFAENDGEASIINFSRNLSGTIPLNSTLTINSIDLSILGPGVDQITVSGNDQHRVLMIPLTSERFFMSGLTISNGFTSGSNQGAGIYVQQATETRLENIRVVNNTSNDSNGGGIFVHLAGLRLTNSEISNNTAELSGGGIGINGGFGNDVFLENVTISSNHSNNGTPGISVTANSGQNIELKFITSAFNTGSSVDNHINNSGNITIESSVFVPGLSLQNTSNVTNNSIVQNLLGGVNLNGSNNLTGTGSLDLKPLAALNDTGLKVHAFDTDSIAYNHVDNMAGNSGCGVSVTSDQIGTARPTDGFCDAGAYEYIYIDVIFANGFE